jgi:uncharacterized oligopeptide transporter (OPT) family protein
MKIVRTFTVILLAAALVLSTPLVTQARTRTVVFVGIGGGIIVVGGAFLIWGLAVFSKKGGRPHDDKTRRARYVGTEGETGKQVAAPEAEPVLHVPLLTLRF